MLGNIWSYFFGGNTPSANQTETTFGQPSPAIVQPVEKPAPPAKPEPVNAATAMVLAYLLYDETFKLKNYQQAQQQANDLKNFLGDHLTEENTRKAWELYNRFYENPEDPTALAAASYGIGMLYRYNGNYARGYFMEAPGVRRSVFPIVDFERKARKDFDQMTAQKEPLKFTILGRNILIDQDPALVEQTSITKVASVDDRRFVNPASGSFSGSHSTQQTEKPPFGVH
jgi:hypothetical protein